MKAVNLGEISTSRKSLWANIPSMVWRKSVVGIRSAIVNSVNGVTWEVFNGAKESLRSR